MHSNTPVPEAILVIGAGELGMSVLAALSSSAEGNGTTLSVLLRPLQSPATQRDPDATTDLMHRLGVDIVRADLATQTVEELAVLFAPFTTIVCCSGFVGGPGTQARITRAVLEAGVRRFIPWQFGVDYDIVGHGSGQEVFDEQADVRALLRAQSNTHWIIVSTGMFTSFLFEPAFGLVDLQAGRVHALGSWDNQLTVTTPEDIGRLTAAILAQQPPIHDEVVFVAGDTFTYAQLADKVDHHLRRRSERVLWDVDALREVVAGNPADGMAKYRLAFARDTGVAWPMERTFNACNGIPVTDVAGWLARSGPFS